MKTGRYSLLRKVGSLISIPILIFAIISLYSLALYSSNVESIKDIAQEVKITIMGKVLDVNSDVVEGVMIKEMESENETTSDSDGKFTLLLNEPATVVFSKFGFQEMKMEITESDSNFVVKLTPESNEMKVQAFSSEMNVNNDHKWLIDSLSAIIDNSPLYIINDRQEESDFSISTIDPDDVVTVEVLSDSIAEALYGSDGERGAVRITTNSSSNITERQTPPMQLNNNDTAATILRDKYKMYLDTMNARNARLRERNNKGLKRNAQLPTKNDHSIDSLNSLNEKGLDEKMNSPLDTTLIESKNDTTTLKMQVDTTYIENKRDTINSVNDIK